MPKPQKIFTYRDNQALDKDVTQLYDFVSRGEVVTVAPNGNKKGRKGDFVFYDNAGTFTLWVNKDNLTSWGQI